MTAPLLDTVLQQRKLQMDQAQSAVRQAQAACDQAASALNQARESCGLLQARPEMDAARGVTHLQRMVDYERALAVRLEHAEASRRAALATWERARATLADAQQRLGRAHAEHEAVLRRQAREQDALQARRRRARE